MQQALSAIEQREQAPDIPTTRYPCPACGELDALKFAEMPYQTGSLFSQEHLFGRERNPDSSICQEVGPQQHVDDRRQANRLHPQRW